MTATIRPLKNKYYGTVIEYRLPNGDTGTIEIWEMSGYTPSERQLKHDGYGDISKWREDDMGCDGHYETEMGYAIAKKICSALNGEGK